MSAQPRQAAGIAMSLAIGQHVRHQDFGGKRVTGRVTSLSIDDNVLSAVIVLDAPIVIPARGEGDRPVDIWRQCVPAHELTPFDERDEVIAELVAALEGMTARHDALGAQVADQRLLDAAYAAIAKVKGAAA